MEPARPPETLRGNGDPGGVDVASWVSVSPGGLWKVQQKRKHEWSRQTVSSSGDVTSCSSGYCPKLGSLCRVRVRLKADEDEAETSVSEKRDEELPVQPRLSVADVGETAATPFRRCPDSVLQVPLGHWTTLRLGDGQCDITEACLGRMRAGERCEIRLSVFGNGPDVTTPQRSDGNLPLCASIELQTFTPGKESWEMSPGERWEWAKSLKETGGGRFRSGDVWGAADSYSQALKLLIALGGHVREAEEQKDTNAADETRRLPSADGFRTTKAELHSNLSLCQLKLKQPERAKASAAKATELDPGGAKAWYRLGQACQMVNELEEAKRAFQKLLKIQPELPAALKALKDIANREKETNAQLGLRLSKMFS
ncbi:FK506-binding protein-like [Brachyistius frenatus]|uniref:FK506-binding protein-like n=1 Tax=Brachyistius frenatus TaxID=100188 RepID=UPI0037E80A7E